MALRWWKGQRIRQTGPPASAFGVNRQPHGVGAGGGNPVTAAGGDQQPVAGARRWRQVVVNSSSALPGPASPIRRRPVRTRSRAGWRADGTRCVRCAGAGGEQGFRSALPPRRRKISEKVWAGIRTLGRGRRYAVDGGREKKLRRDESLFGIGGFLWCPGALEKLTALRPRRRCAKGL